MLVFSYNDNHHNVHYISHWGGPLVNLLNKLLSRTSKRNITNIKDIFTHSKFVADISGIVPSEWGLQKCKISRAILTGINRNGIVR